MCTFHVWPDDVTCPTEDLEEYLGFKSDDYLTYSITDETIEVEPTYNEVATLLSL